MNGHQENSTPHKDRRRWWVALLLLFPTGVGYIYVGRPWRFVGFMAFILLGMLAVYSGIWSWLSHQMGYLAILVACFVVVIGFAIDIVKIAITQNRHDLRWPQRRKWYVASLAIWLAIALTPDAINALTTQSASANTPPARSRSFISHVISTLTTLPFRFFSVPSRSMAPVLKVGDYFIANAMIYTYSDPRRGDVVVFRLPSNTKVDFVKRVIGLPGDKVQMINGEVVLNGVAVRRQPIKNYESNWAHQVKQFTETLPNGRTYQTLDLLPNGKFDNTRLYQVPQGHYFVLGDNRDNSNDSRILNTVGFVPRKNIHAKATSIVYARARDRIGSTIK